MVSCVLYLHLKTHRIHTGLTKLEGIRADQASQLQHLVRAHFDSYVRCADKIEQYAAQIEAELSSKRGAHETPQQAQMQAQSTAKALAQQAAGE